MAFAIIVLGLLRQVTPVLNQRRSLVQWVTAVARRIFQMSLDQSPAQTSLDKKEMSYLHFYIRVGLLCSLIIIRKKILDGPVSQLTWQQWPQSA